jgi:hypothetical protein
MAWLVVAQVGKEAMRVTLYYHESEVILHVR